MQPSFAGRGRPDFKKPLTETQSAENKTTRTSSIQKKRPAYLTPRKCPLFFVAFVVKTFHSPMACFGD
ncbi:MAG TPA: hypothetical protein ENK43_15575 [Planctomycetes bacterium]|nr:hypothetical protein [Planctomycetota bacterium]